MKASQERAKVAETQRADAVKSRRLERALAASMAEAEALRKLVAEQKETAPKRKRPASGDRSPSFSPKSPSDDEDLKHQLKRLREDLSQTNQLVADEKASVRVMMTEAKNKHEDLVAKMYETNDDLYVRVAENHQVGLTQTGSIVTMSVRLTEVE